MRDSEPIVYVIEPDPVPAMPGPKVPVSRWPARVVGVSVTVLLHLFLTIPMVLGMAAHKVKPPTQDGLGTVNFASKGDESEAMILLDLSAMAANAPDTPAPDIKTDGIIPDEPRLALVSVELQPPPALKIDDAEEADTANDAAGDPAGNAAMFGRYMGQVSARIERAWMRPRTPVEGGRFTCRARIAQDRQGNVESVDLQDCDGDQAWRQSLTSAIMRASPLSAPPEPRFFTSSLTLSFTGEQYVAKQTPEYEYEPVNMRVAAVTAPVALFREEQPVGQAKPSQPAVLDGNGDVSLTITGSEVRWEKKDPVSRK